MMKKVITYGTFDLFHEGHYRLLERAKALGDYLIVGITTEQYDATRGKLNVVDSLITRIDNVRATGFVDEVVIEDHAGQKVEDILKYNVDIFTVGSDWEGQFEYLRQYCDVVYLERTKNISSTLKRADQNPVIKLGIVGTGRIANRFPKEIKYVSGMNLQGAYNPHDDHAKSYAQKWGLSFWTNDYEEFLYRVDAVVIASPHETHYQYAKAALEHGKHVLCEKPMVFSRAQAEELFAIAEKNNVVLMEAIKTAYCPGFNHLLGVVQSGAIGEVRDVEAAFSRLIEAGSRELTDAEYGGAFTEYASYSLLPIIKLLGTDYRSISFNSIPLENGPDAYTKAVFIYDNALATTKNGVAVKTEGQLLISGTKGYILAPSPWWQTRTFEVRYEDPSKIDNYSDLFLGDGLRYEVADFAKAIAAKRNPTGVAHIYKMSRTESIAMAGIMEEFLKQRR